MARTIPQVFIAMVAIGMLVSGCSADRGHWRTLTDAPPGAGKNMATYVEKFGNPLSFENTMINWGGDENPSVIPVQKAHKSGRQWSIR